MEPTAKEKMLFGKYVDVLDRKDNKAVYQLKDESGSAKMTSYQVFEGIILIYNEVHMQSVLVDILPPEEMYEINHCREGRIECEFNNGEYLYISKGDFSVNRKNGGCNQTYFPISHYHGISIAISPKEAQNTIDYWLGKSKVDLRKLIEMLCGKKSFFLIGENKSLEHIFSELYDVPDKIREDYFRLKVLEVILFLSTFEEKKKENRSYFSRRQVEKIKLIQKQITEQLDKKFTLNQLAIEHKIALTSMKKCFKGVFGIGIHSYMKNYRMNAAAKMLLETDDTILCIANRVGYENASKFSTGFKELIGLSPKEFRRSKEITSIREKY